MQRKIYKTEKERKRIYKKCCDNLYFLGKEILGFDDADIEPHRRMCKFFEMDIRCKMMVGSRGIFKTSFGTIGRAIQLCMINPNVRILVVCNTADNARQKVGQIKDQFDRNVKLRELMGSIIPMSTRGRESKRWSRLALVLNRTGIHSEATVTAAGVETQLAGDHYDWILGDDIVSAGRDDLKEDGMIILRPEENAKAIGWFGLTFRGLSILKKDKSKRTKIQFTLNRWGVKDFAAYIIEEHLKSDTNPDGFEYMEMAAHNEDGSLLWDAVLDEEELASIRKSQGEFMYFTQYECKPYNPSDRGFPPDNNTYWEGTYPPGYEDGGKKYNMYALMDIADALNPQNCYTAMVVLWVDEMRHIWVGEAVRAKIDTNHKIRLIHRMVKKYGLKKVCIEKNLLDDTLRFVLKDAMDREKIKYRIMPLEHKNRNKDARILRLQPHHEQGALHIKRSHKELLQEMRDFGYTHLRDIVDTLGYIMDFIRKPPLSLMPPEIKDKPDNVVTLEEIRVGVKSYNTNIYGGGAFPSQNLSRKSAADNTITLEQIRERLSGRRRTAI